MRDSKMIGAISDVIRDAYTDQSLRGPTYCFTLDTDWAPEHMIEKSLEIFNELRVPLTPFITNKSPAIEQEYADKRKCVGLHPNFMPGSSHGNNYKEVIEHAINLWPEAISFRSHCFYDDWHITREFHRRGFRYDSNICLDMQPHITPLYHDSELIRFPVFLQDASYLRNKSFWHPHDIHSLLSSTGIKVIAFHAVHVYLNTPNWQYYKKYKQKCQTVRDTTSVPSERQLARRQLNKWPPSQQWGMQNLLVELIDLVKLYKHRTLYLDDLYEEVKKCGF